jgi:hypothetical protein
MFFGKVLAFGFVATAMAAPVIEVDTYAQVSQEIAAMNVDLSAASQVDDIIKNIKTLEGHVKALDASISGFDGKHGAKENDIRAKAKGILADIENVTKSVKASPQLDAPNSVKVSTAFLNFLPSVKKTLADATGKKPQFKQANAIAELKTNLEKQKTLSNDLGNALNSKLDKTLRSQGTTINNTVQKQFTEAISKIGN